MNAFDTAWTLLKADKEKCPSCDMSKSECMTQKMGCGGEMKKAYVMRKAAFKLKYDYNTLRKDYRQNIEGNQGYDYSDGPEMHGLASDVAQEYFVEHINDMNAMNTGISGRDSAPSRVGVSSPQIPEQRNNQ